MRWGRIGLLNAHTLSFGSLLIQKSREHYACNVRVASSNLVSCSM